jgi:hypothetical protein
MFEEMNQSSFWTWVGRIADLTAIIGLPSAFFLLRRYFRRLVSRRRIEAKPIGIDPQFKGLICCVSKLPAAAEPELVRSSIDLSPDITEKLRQGPIGAVLKAFELHRKHLRHCWLIASPDSAACLELIKQACRKYFPDVRLHEKPVTDVYEKIDDVFETTHGIFRDCEQETDGELRRGDIIVDVTGGTKIMSIAVAMACLDADRQLEYIEQREQKTFYRIDITWEKIHTVAASGDQSRDAAAAPYELRP